MKKKFALSLVALASVAVLAACGEVKSGASNSTGFFNDTATTEIYTLIDTLSLHDALL